VKAGSTAGQLVLSIDLAPTLMELAGLTPLEAMQGRSLAPVFNESSLEWRRSFLIEYYSDTVFPRILNMGYSAVRTDRYKYIAYRELQGMNELYDLDTDPYEEHNLVGEVGTSSLQQEMEKELKRLLTETAADRGVRTPATSAGE
jgi:N-acetylglucosamine-6-sulfatase